jgi:hypothetical protein
MAVNAAWLLLLWTRLAAAEGLGITWSAPEECPGGAALRERIAGALQRSLDSFDQETEFRGTVARDAEGYRLVLVSRRGSERGRRVIRDSDCDALTSAAALAIALALRVHAEEPPPAAPAAAEEPRPSRGAPRPGPRRGWVALVAAGQADSGTLPSPSAGPELGFQAGVGGFEGGLRGGTLGPKRELREGKGGRFWLASGQAEACVLVIARQPATLATCALLEVGRLKGSGTGVDHPRVGSAFWIAGGGRLSSALRLGQSRFSALLGVSALHPARRRSFMLNGHQQVHRPAVMVGRLELGIVVDVW